MGFNGFQVWHYQARSTGLVVYSCKIRHICDERMPLLARDVVCYRTSASRVPRDRGFLLPAMSISGLLLFTTPKCLQYLSGSPCLGY